MGTDTVQNNDVKRKMEDKIKPNLNGAAETMLQSFYARAMYSKSPKHKFKDEKAEEIVERLDYDFAKAGNDYAMSGGVIARTVVFDREKVEKSIQSTGAKFTWGANSFDELGDIAEGFRKVKDDNILRGMWVLNPMYKLITWLPIMKKITQKILIFEKIPTGECENG